MYPMEFVSCDAFREYMELAVSDYNTKRSHSSLNYMTLDEFERRWNESEDFRNKFLEERTRKEERILKNRIEKKRRLKENVSLEDRIS